MNSMKPTTKSPAHILAVEDNDVQAMMLRYLLEKEGYKVTLAKNGKIALDLAVQTQPALIISDVNMPEMDGYELCKVIKSSPSLDKIPVILVTSMQEPVDLLNGLKSGADSFVIKPYNRSNMLERVAHALGSQDMHAAPEDNSALEITFHGEKHQLNANRTQILNLLMSTYESTHQRNLELIKSREQLQDRTAQLLEANRFLNLILDIIPNPIFIKDAVDLKFVKLNRASEDMIGLSRDQMLGKNDHDFLPKYQAEINMSYDRQVLASRELLDIPESRLQTMHHGVRLMHTKKAAVVDENGVATHVLGIAEDITERKEREREIFELNEALKYRAHELEVVNQSLEGFTATITHDLRSPLCVIEIYVGMLRDYYAHVLDEKALHYVSAIGGTAKNMLKLIDDMLAFSRLGQGEVIKNDMDVHLQVEQVIAEQQLLHPNEKKSIIQLNPLPRVQADPRLLRQVWVNLLSNAVKYSRHAASPQIEVTGRLEGNEAIYSVRDNGAGFDMAHYPKLFEVFQRLHTEEEFEGTGIGLPIVHRIVSRHGGRVWAEGKVGEGAVFHFALPV